MESWVVSGLGGLMCSLECHTWIELKLDDPVGAIAVHGMAGFGGTIPIGLFAHGEGLALSGGEQELVGLFHGGGPALLAIQLTGASCVLVFTAGLVSGFLWVINYFFGLRVSGDIRRARFGSRRIRSGELQRLPDLLSLEKSLGDDGHRRT